MIFPSTDFNAFPCSWGCRILGVAIHWDEKGMVISRYSLFLKFCMHLNFEFLRQNSKLKCMQKFWTINCTLRLAAPLSCIFHTENQLPLILNYVLAVHIYWKNIDRQVLHPRICFSEFFNQIKSKIRHF